MFKHAIVKKPCKALINGITTVPELGKPDYELAMKQHAAYVRALEECGLDVLVLDADERYPDSVFVEDPAVVTADCAIITNPATDSRNGEKYEIVDAIKKYYTDDQIGYIEAPGTLEGGDIMLVDKHFFIGQSGRTNAEGAKQFLDFMGKFGYTGETVKIAEGLHLKDYVVYLEDGTLLISKLFSAMPCFAPWKQLVVDDDELYAVNVININGKVLAPKGYPKTLKMLADNGYDLIEIDSSEFKKIDGSLTCMSLRF